MDKAFGFRQAFFTLGKMVFCFSAGLVRSKHVTNNFRHTFSIVRDVPVLSDNNLISNHCIGKRENSLLFQ